MQPSTGWSVALAALLLAVLTLQPARINAAATHHQGVRSGRGWPTPVLCDPSTHVACRNRPDICIPFERLQDGQADCPDASDEDCQPWEFECPCGSPRCISQSLVSNGVLDCADGADEGLIGGHCNGAEDLQDIDDLIRYRRSSDLRVEVNGADTTTFYLRTEAARTSPRPLGLITSSAGVFVNDGTTTQYSTVIAGTSIDGTYAKVQSATSRVFSLIEDDEEEEDDDQPTGIVSSTVVTRIRGETTTVETTQFVRTFIDQAYAQEILTSSEIFAPLRTDADGQINNDASGINPSSPTGSAGQVVVPTLVIDSSLSDETNSDGGQRLFKTAHLTSIVGERVNLESSLTGVVGVDDVTDEEELSDEEHDRRKIISTSFDEQVDNNLRDARARQQQLGSVNNLAEGDAVEPAKPKIAIETFVADGAARSPPARIQSEEEENDEDAPVSESEDLAISTEPPPTEETIAAVTDEPKEIVDVPVVSKPVNQLAADASSTREARVETAGPTTLSPSRVRGTVTLSRNRGPVSLLQPPPQPQASVDSTVAPATLSRSRTRSLSTISRATATTTRPLVQPTGLLSTFEGSLVFDGVTTVYTSSIFGTFIDGEYANIVSSTSTLIFPTASAVEATPTVSLISSTVISPSPPVIAVIATVEPEAPLKAETESPIELDGSLNEPTEADPSVLLETPTSDSQLPAVTRLTTFTFFTTFFSTGADEEVVTSVSTREVISSEVVFVTETPKGAIADLDAPTPVVTTQLTTFTYFETFFDDRTTQTQSREEVVTNVVTLFDGAGPSTVTALDGNRLEPTKTPDDRIGGASGIESSLLDMETSTEGDTDASGLTATNVGSKRKQFFNSLASGIVKTFLTTFTFFTTALVNGTTRVSSRIVISTNAVTPTVSLTEIDEDLWESLKAQDDRSRSAEISVTPTPTQTSEATSEVVAADVSTTSTTSAPEAESQPPLVSPPAAGGDVTGSTDSPTAGEDETTVSSTKTTTSSSASSSTTTEEPQVSSSEAPIDVEIDPSAPETGTEAAEEAARTFFTTFTYFTTFFTEGTSNIVSSESTVTNVVTDPAELTLMEATMSADVDAPAAVQPTIFPITYYTTFTYRTTSFSEEETIVSTREETITNVVTPTIASILLDGDQSVVETLVTPTPTLAIVPTVDPGLITFYTTFTYFTTSFESETAVVTSSLETITNIVTATPSALFPEASTARNIAGNTAADEQLILDLNEPTASSKPQPTGLLSTIRSTQVLSGRTTIFTTDVLGTFINGQYARILESSSEVLDNARLPPTVIVAATGVQDVDTTDLFFPSLTPAAGGVDLEGSLQSPGGASVSGQEDDSSSGGRVSSRLNLLNRNRTFTPTIRPFTQRPRPPAIGIKNNRKPGAAAAVEGSSDLNAVGSAELSGSFTPSAAGPQSSTRSSFSSRFRSSIAASGSSNVFASSSSNAADGSSRSQFFRLRGSSSASAAASSASIFPTPVIGSSSSRRFSPGFQAAQSVTVSPPSISASLRPSIGIGARRPSTLAGAPRSSSAGPIVSITTSRFGRPTSAAPPVEIGDDSESSTGAPIVEEIAVIAVETPVVAARPPSSLRRPSPLNRPPNGDSTAVIATPVQIGLAPTRRQFPRPSANARPVVASESSEKSIETGRSIKPGPVNDLSNTDDSSSGPATSRPRFRAPPKVTFTEKPRPAVRLPTRPNSRRGSSTAPPVVDTEADQSSDASNVDPVVIDRSKRQISFDYYFYDPIHYRRPSRGSSSRSRGRSSSRVATQEPKDYDYDYEQTVVKSRSPQEWEEYDYDSVVEEPVTTKPKSSSSSVRDRINANKEKSAARASSSTSTSTGSTRSSSKSRTSSSGTSRSSGSSGVSRMRKPVPEEVATAPKRTSSSSRSSSSGTTSKTRARTKTSSSSAATERRGEVSSSSRRTFGNSGRGRGSSSSRGKVAQAANDFDDDGISLKSSIGSVTSAGSVGATAPLLAVPLSVTHKVPSETVIPVLGTSGQTEFKTVITAKPSVEVLSQYLTVKVSGTWRYIASEISSTQSPGVTVVTQFVLKPTETTTVTFTPTVIRGRKTSFSHVVPSTVYDVETVVSTISDPVASTNSLLQQLLLGGLQQANNANGQPVTSFSTHTSTFVTTLTELRSTKIPITLRGQEIFTTIVGTSTSVITATEFSTQTIITGGQPTDTPVNPLVNLLPALLGNPLLAGQLLQQPQQQQQAQLALQPILTTAAPAQLTATHRELETDIFDEIFEDETDQQQQETIEPEKPLPQTSVITLFLSGRRPGEFSSVLSTITLDGGSDSSVVKRQTAPDDKVQEVMQVEPSSLPLMVGTERGVYQLPEMYSSKDLDYYVMSAINEIGAELIVDQMETQRLETIIRNAYVPKNVYKQPSVAAKARKVRQALSDTDELLIAEEIADSNVDLVRVPLTKSEITPLKSASTTATTTVGQQQRQVRRKTVTVTRKLSAENIKDLADLEDFVSPNRARKVVVVNRKKSQEPAKEKKDETPSISSSQFEDEDRDSSSPFGNIHAPRTYYTVYSYFYTLMNGPSSGSVSTREVSISEIVRGGADGRLPPAFQRTENNNGIYSLNRGSSTADLSTRVNAGITTQVNLVSMTLVKYGRGSLTTTSVIDKPAIEKSVARVVNRLTVSSTPKLDPSFEAFTSSALLDEEEDSNTATIAPTQRLTTAQLRRTTAKTSRPSASTSATANRKSAFNAVVDATTKRTLRGRGTVRFNAASILADEPDISSVLSSVMGSSRSRGGAKALKHKEQEQQRGGRLSSAVRRPSAVHQHHEPADLNDQDYEDFHAFTDDEEEFEEEEFDHLGDDEEEIDVEEDEQVVGPAQVLAAESSSLVVIQPVPVVIPVNPTVTLRPTKPIGVTPTSLRTTISRKLLNPLESHLSSILANSRSSLKAVSSSGTSVGITQHTTNDPGASASSFRTRLPNRGSNSAQPTSFQTSTVVLKTFETLSTLAVDGGRSGIPLTLITSTLTTLYDAELALLTQSPEMFKQVIEPTLLPVSRPKQLNFNPTARLSLPVRASVAIGNNLLPSWSGSIEPSIEDTTTEFVTDAPSSIAELLQQLAGSSISSTITFVETHMRTFTAVVTRRSGDEEVVTTRLQVVPEVVTKTIVPVQPSQVVDVEGSIESDDNILPTARAVPPRDGSQSVLVAGEEEEQQRLARLNIGANNRNQNFATKVMSNGVEVIVAGEKKPSLLAQNVIQHSQTVIEPSPPVTLAASTLKNQVTLASEVDNVRLFSSIQSDPAKFWTQTQMTTFLYVTTLLDGASKVVSSSQEVITNLVTQETGHSLTQSPTSVTVTSGFPHHSSPSYDTLTHLTTYTYFNTFMDLKRPVVLTSQETVANVVTVPAGHEASAVVERSFETSTYLRTYTFSSKIDRDAVATSKEVVTQIVVTEAPRLVVRPTPVATFTEVTKTYLSTVTFVTTELEGTESVIRRVTTVRPEVVVETVRDDIEPTPLIEGSQIVPTENDFGFGQGPLLATKTYFTTMTHFTTLVHQGTKTVVQSRKEVKSSVVTETIEAFGGLSGSVFSSASDDEDGEQQQAAQNARPTYVQLGPNLYGKLRTLFATATYFITNSAGQVTSKRLVVPQVSTETIGSIDSLPIEALIEPSVPVVQGIDTTAAPGSQILSAEQLSALKQSFIAGLSQTTSLASGTSSVILSPEQLSSLKESFLASQSTTLSPSLPTDSGFTSELTTDFSTDVPDVEGGFIPPEISLSPPNEGGATVIMVTNSAGEVLIIPTEILTSEPSSTSSDSSSSTGLTSASGSTSSSSSGSSVSGGTLATILGGLGTIGLTALGQTLAGNNPGGLNINLGPVFDAMTGVLSNGLIAASSRRNSTDRSDSPQTFNPNLPPNMQQQQQPLLNNGQFQSASPRQPSHDPQFIPIGGLAGIDGLSQQPPRDAQGRRPSSPQTFIPLRPQQSQQQLPQRPPPGIRRPEPGVPLQPGVPGSPLMRPGSPGLNNGPPQQFNNLQVIPGQPIRVNFNPSLQSGFTAMPNQPNTRLPLSGAGSTGPGPRPFVNGQNNIDRLEIQPSRPLQPNTNSQFFAANGQPINVPPLPPPPPTGPVPQSPVQAIKPGAIVPGPDGKPVRIVPVPEGQQPPPGAGGQVFIRPVGTEQGRPAQAPTNIRGNEQLQPPRRPDEGSFIVGVGQQARPTTQFQMPAVQTIASIEGENKIVRTNIISNGQTIVLQPNDPTPVLSQPVATAAVLAIRPSVVTGAGSTVTESPEEGGAIEVVGNILKPGLAPPASSPATSQATEDNRPTSPNPTVAVTPSREFTFESESGEAVHTPSLDLFLNSPSTEIMPSVFETNNAPSTEAETPFATFETEPFGVTSIVMGVDQTFTTLVSRVQQDGRTAMSTIIHQVTLVKFIEPSTTVPLTPTATTGSAVEVEDEFRATVPGTFPSDSPFHPPTKVPFRPAETTSSSAKPSSAVPTEEPEAPVAKDVIEENKDNKFVLGGFGGIFGVNQQPPANIQDGCHNQCSKEKLEVCIYANGLHSCMCKPGYSRSDSFEPCSKTFTYQLKLVLERVNNTMIHYDDNLRNEISPQYRSLASRARSGLSQQLLKTDLSDSFQDSQVMGIHPTSESELQNEGVLVDFYVHLKEKQEESELKNKLMKSLEGTNFILGESEITAARFSDSLQAEDFDECSHEGHHDCSEFAECINEKGTYRCQCRAGFVDSSIDEREGRICLGERQDCEDCNGNGRCVFEPSSNEMTCVCNKWFTGKECQVNLKVVMIVVLAVGIFLILLVAAIIVVCCLRSRRAKGSISGGPSFLRYRGPSVPTTGTLDRAAMIRGDTSSESSGNDNFAQGTSTLDGKARGPAPTGAAALQSYRPYGDTLIIPRAKHQHGPINVTASMHPGSAERGEASNGNREHQLMDYLDARPGGKKDARSAEVLSAGGRTSVSSTSQFRDSLENVESTQQQEAKPDHSVTDMTVSEVRSFDETTIHPATRRPAHYYQSDDSDNSNFDSL